MGRPKNTGSFIHPASRVAPKLERENSLYTAYRRLTELPPGNVTVQQVKAALGVVGMKRMFTFTKLEELEDKGLLTCTILERGTRMSLILYLNELEPDFEAWANIVPRDTQGADEGRILRLNVEYAEKKLGRRANLTIKDWKLASRLLDTWPFEVVHETLVYYWNLPASNRNNSNFTEFYSLFDGLRNDFLEDVETERRGKKIDAKRKKIAENKAAETELERLQKELAQSKKTMPEGAPYLRALEQLIRREEEKNG